MPTLLIVHHTPSPPTHDLLLAALAGADSDGLEDIEVLSRPALGLTVPDVLEADGYLLGTPANFGYMSGALKHALDTVYYPTLGATDGRPWGLWVHGNSDLDGAVDSVRRIVAGLGWEAAFDPVRVIGPPTPEALAQVEELAATVAANLLP